MEQLPGILLYCQNVFKYELPPDLVFIHRLLTDLRCVCGAADLLLLLLLLVLTCCCYCC